MNRFVFRRRVAASAPLALALAVSSAFAQSAADSTVLVTAARTPQSARDVLADYTVITREELQRAGQSTLVDLLQQKRGIEITRTGGAGNVSSVFIRGTANSQSIVLVDGVRIGSSALGGATWETIPLSQIERVEIVYGPMSTLYGADALGGVIQVFTRQGAGAPSVEAGIGAGSYGTRMADAGVSGSTDGAVRLRYAFHAGHEKADGFSASKPGAGTFTYNPDKDGYTKDSIGARLAAEYAPGHEAGISILHSRLDTQFDAGAAGDDRNVFELNTYAIHSRDRLAQNWTSLVQLSRAEDNGDTAASYGKSHSNTRQDQLSWQNDIAFGTDLLQLIAERREEKVDTSSAAVSGQRSTNSLAATYTLRRGEHSAAAGVRTDRSTQYGTHNTGSLEYGYRFSPALRAVVDIGTSFRAPTFNELYYPGYGIASNQPERGRNLEAGLHYTANGMHASATYYRNKVTDLLVYASVCPVEKATHAFGCAYNVDQALLEGLSLSGDAQLGAVGLRATLDLQDPQDESTGKRLARRAKKHGSVGADYAVGAWKAGGELVFSDARFDDVGNNNRLGGYGILNLYANYTFAPGWSAVARWNNATDKNYELARNYATPGSNLFVGLRYGMK